MSNYETKTFQYTAQLLLPQVQTPPQQTQGNQKAYYVPGIAFGFQNGVHQTQRSW